MGSILHLSLPRLLFGCSSNGSKGRRICRGPRAVLQANDDDPLLRAAIKAAALRCQETNRPDGMDTRPYRLKWPQATMIIDISSERIFKIGSERLKGAGAKISRSNVFIHVPWESCDIRAALRSKGFTGNRPSIWALQGLPVMTLSDFKEILLTVGSLAMKGSIFLGEMPAWLAETKVASKSNIQEWMHEFFMSNGFWVSVVSYEEIAGEVLRDLPSGDYRNILFVAEQLQLSDDQMEHWRKEFQRLEEEADEEGFEEL